jgi:hypothetical protein
MPRPPDGYFNAADQPIPGTHDPISRYMDKQRLMYWAHKQGRLGIPLNNSAAINIGSAVHSMVEHDLLEHPDSAIIETAHILADDEHIAKAITAFNAYRVWQRNVQLQPIAVEEPLISERYQYGGTPDVVGYVNGRLALVDFKSAAEPYSDNLVALAAHANLWNEHHPCEPIETCWLLCLPKDGGVPRDFMWGAADLRPQWLQFRLWLRAFRLEAACDEVMRNGLLATGCDADREFMKEQAS